MYEVKSNIPKNRIYLVIKGKVDLEEIKKVSAAIIAESKRLKTGFGVISNIMDFIPADESVRTVMMETMRLMKEGGMGHVVRIVKQDGVVVANQWQRTSRQAGYSAEQAYSVEEAEHILDGI